MLASVISTSSLKTKVRMPVCPVESDETLEVTVKVGGVLSVKAMLTVLFASLPSWLALPAAFVKTPLATLTEPVTVESL